MFQDFLFVPPLKNRYDVRTIYPMKNSSPNPALSLSDAQAIYGSRSEAVLLEGQITDKEVLIKHALQQKETTDDSESLDRLQEEIHLLSEQVAVLRRRQKQVLREQGKNVYERNVSSEGEGEHSAL